jgi:protein-S-isoprenylcysteine O-methyltransferase Ste14
VHVAIWNADCQCGGPTASHLQFLGIVPFQFTARRDLVGHSIPLCAFDHDIAQNSVGIRTRRNCRSLAQLAASLLLYLNRRIVGCIADINCDCDLRIQVFGGRYRSATPELFKGLNLTAPIAAESVRTLASHDINQLGFRWRGVFGVIFLAPAAVVALLSQRAFSAPVAGLVSLFLGWPTFLIGLFLRVWSTLYVGGRKTTKLVTEGPYSLCRNPLYLGSFFVALSAGFFLDSLVFAGAVALTMLCYVSSTVPAEEQKLRELHNENFDEYCRRVPRFWPSLRNFNTPKTITVSVKALRIEAKRLMLWFWPTLFHLP